MMNMPVMQFDCWRLVNVCNIKHHVRAGHLCRPDYKFDLSAQPPKFRIALHRSEFALLSASVRSQM